MVNSDLMYQELLRRIICFVFPFLAVQRVLHADIQTTKLYQVL